MTRSTTVESKRKLVEIIVKMSGADGTLMGSQEPPLKQRRNEMNPGQQFVSRFWMIAQECDAMAVAMRLQPIVTQPPIGVYQTARFDDIVNKTLKTIGRRVRNTAQANATDPATAAGLFYGYDNQGLFERPATPNPSFVGTQVGLVHLDFAVQSVAVRPHHCAAQFVQPGPSRLVAAEPEHLLQPEGAGPGLLTRNVPHCPEPYGERRTRVLEDSSRRKGDLPTTGGTLQKGASYRPRFRSSANRAPEAVRPTQLSKVRPTGLLPSKSLLKFSLGPRIIFHGPLHYILGLPESRGYPITGIPENMIATAITVFAGYLNMVLTTTSQQTATNSEVVNGCPGTRYCE